jgi:hypothetical protein
MFARGHEVMSEGRQKSRWQKSGRGDTIKDCLENGCFSLCPINCFVKAAVVRVLMRRIRETRRLDQVECQSHILL